jgi:hypothetical protein
MSPLPPSLPISTVHRESSAIYRDYLIYLAKQGIHGVSVQRVVYESFGWAIVSIPPFHQLSTHALQQLMLANHIQPVLFLHDQFDSLRYIMKTLLLANEAASIGGQDNFLMMSAPEETLVWAYAPWQVRPIAAEAGAWHLDAIYKLLSCKKGLFAIIIRGPTGRGIPVCYFIVGKEDAESIGLVLKTFCRWVGAEPGAWIHDCQAALIRAIEDYSPDSTDFLCVFHAIRAWDRQIRTKCRMTEAAEGVIQILHQIAMEIEDPSNADAAITEIRVQLQSEPAALSYLEAIWFSRFEMGILISWRL